MRVQVLLVHASNACAVVVFKRVGERLGGVLASDPAGAARRLDASQVFGYSCGRLRECI